MQLIFYWNETSHKTILKVLKVLKSNGPDKKESNNGFEHVGMQ